MGGINPLFSAMNESIKQLASINATVSESLAGGTCSPITNLKSVGTGSISSLITLDDIQNTIGCSAINPEYQSLVYGLMCDSVTEGLYWLWSVQVSAAFMLYVGLYIISYTKEKVLLQLTVNETEYSAPPAKEEPVSEKDVQMHDMTEKA